MKKNSMLNRLAICPECNVGRYMPERRFGRCVSCRRKAREKEKAVQVKECGWCGMRIEKADKVVDTEGKKDEVVLYHTDCYEEQYEREFRLAREL